MTTTEGTADATASSETIERDDARESTHREYVLDVRVVETTTVGETRYRFEAPEHVDIDFADAATAELYADVYFDVNGFVEAGTGDRGIPPQVVQAGKDTLAAYLVTMPDHDVNWVASFYGKKPDRIERYCSWVQKRAAEIRAGVAEREDC